MTEYSYFRDLSGGPVVQTSPSSAGDVDLIPCWGARSHIFPSQKAKA